MNIELIKAAFATRWKAFTAGWLLNDDVVKLCAEVERLKAELHIDRDALHISKLEIAHLKDKLAKQEAAQVKAQAHVNKLWQFIAARHRLDVPPDNGSIREILQESEGR